jgi:hypothetical protein
LTKRYRVVTIYTMMKGGESMSIKKVAKAAATTCKCKSSC